MTVVPRHSWLYWGAVFLNSFGLLVELLFAVFLTFEFLKRHSNLKHAYYYILYITYTIDLISSTAWFIREFVGNNESIPLVGIANLVRWYYYFCPGIWELMFAINRYTAICSPGIHIRIWKGKKLYLILVFILIFPFIVNGYVLFKPHCSMFYKETQCEDYLVMSLHMSSIINVCLTIVALCLIIIGVCLSRNTVRSQTLARVEYKMIVYTAISTTLFIPRHVCVLFTVVIPSQCDFFYDLAMWFFFVQHYLPIPLLPMMNVIYRGAFLRFLRKRIFCRTKSVTIVM